jgi:signal transduction histidine kinase
MRRSLKILMSINSNPFAVKVVITVIAFAAVSCFIVMLELTGHFQEVMSSLNIPKEIIDSSIAIFSQELVITTIILTIIGVNGALLVAYFVTKPIRDLSEASKKIAQGDLSARVTTWGHDELARLGQTFNQMADSIEKYTAEREALVRELMRNEQTRQELLKKVITAQEDERIRISRELHDETGQSLTSLIIGLKLLEDEINNAKHVQTISEMRNLASTTLKEVHRLAVELRPTVLDDIGLIPAIERFVQTYARNYNIDIDFHVQNKNKERLSSEVETALYRIVQEGLTNIVKYAKAKNVSVLLDIKDSGVKLIVEDDGVGFEADKVEYSEDRHLGIAGMKERTLLLNGTFTIESGQGQGTTIYACIPLQRRDINEITD